MLPPEPRLQVSAPKDLKQYKGAQEEILNSYGWVDQNAGVVRIPIERAIDILSHTGLSFQLQRNDLSRKPLSKSPDQSNPKAPRHESDD